MQLPIYLAVVSLSIDPALIEKEVRRLWATGRFADIRVESRNGDHSKAITFHVTQAPRLMLRKVRVTPDDFPLKTQVPAAGFIDSARAKKIAADFEIQILQRGYVDATIEPELVVAGPAQADLLLHVRAGAAVRVEQVRLIGDSGLEAKEVLGAMKSLKVRRIFPGWSKRPPYSRMAVDSGLARLRSLYLSRGYFDASVLLDHTAISGGEAIVSLLLKVGPRYNVRQWRVPGSIEQTYGDFCRCLFDLRRESEKAGILEFAVGLTLQPLSGVPQVDVVAKVDHGRPYKIRRIEFQGNRRFSDRLIRSNLLLDEAEPLDTTRLRKSLDRLNRSWLFESLNESDVDVTSNAKTGLADVRIRLRERKAGSWLLSGPVGPMSIAGPLQFTLASRLPAWGGSFLELSSYYASFSLLAYADPFARILGQDVENKVLPVVALQRPFLPAQAWTSGVTIAPQLGWRATALNYGVTQLRERVLPGMSGGLLPVPPLPVTVARPGGDAVMFCEGPEPRLKWLRRGAGMALQIATSLPAL